MTRRARGSRLGGWILVTGLLLLGAGTGPHTMVADEDTTLLFSWNPETGEKICYPISCGCGGAWACCNCEKKDE